MHDRALVATDRVTPLHDTSAVDGRVVWSPVKSIWISAMAIAGIVGGTLFFSWAALALFVALTGLTICAGHSVGMHRLLIHRAFRTPLWLEHLLVYLGTLVGMSGPTGMIKAHDMRDWHQRQTACPPHPSHNASLWKDAWWQLHCVFQLKKPPVFTVEPARANDRFYRFLDATWMGQQIPVAVILSMAGGWGWVFWGVCLRIAISLTGHWLVGHFAHRRGRQTWRIEGLPVQGYNLPGLGWLTFGENWHGNHHAFPHSARLGLEPGQFDPGYLFVRLLERCGLATGVQLPHSQPAREGLVRVTEGAGVRARNRRPNTRSVATRDADVGGRLDPDAI